ncbi:hypothetical protein OZX62_05210 [Bifidobacterium sp. ESL0690]|uniref:hypothetical protein n=1 Tax=Bifidobacterium sp. ESL0690 TaxID=2983214 RepID=UPI0023F62A53|nr:hypothetical protein [Bifidobacterium sp. ESL0690]WEV47661.1 hypothetical protein OZX62_05210 [Bifidobacterium sp. ESL0690]
MSWSDILSLISISVTTAGVVWNIYASHNEKSKISRLTTLNELVDNGNLTGAQRTVAELEQKDLSIELSLQMVRLQFKRYLLKKMPWHAFKDSSEPKHTLIERGPAMFFKWVVAGLAITEFALGFSILIGFLAIPALLSILPHWSHIPNPRVPICSCLIGFIAGILGICGWCIIQYCWRVHLVNEAVNDIFDKPDMVPNHELLTSGIYSKKMLDYLKSKAHARNGSQKLSRIERTTGLIGGIGIALSVSSYLVSILDIPSQLAKAIAFNCFLDFGLLGVLIGVIGCIIALATYSGLDI